MASASEKAKEARREVFQRQRVYPRLIAQGKLTPTAAARQIALMEEIAADYEKAAEGERLI